MREYRIVKEIPRDLYYAQVRELRCLFRIFGFRVLPFRTHWKTIGEHNDGFGLYDVLGHGTTIEQANSIIDRYEQWVSVKPAYRYFIFDQGSIRNRVERDF